MSIFPIEPLRRAFLQLPKQPRDSDTVPIDSRFFYVPLTHAKALHPDNQLVEGIHGTGKTEWFLQLSKSANLKHIALIAPRAELENTECFIGFGQASDENYPSKAILAQLLGKDITPETIWNTVIALVILRDNGWEGDSWETKIKDYETDIDGNEKKLRRLDEDLHSQQKKHIVLFDALDYASDDWETLKKLLKGLLQVALKFRSFRAIRLKIFVHPEMLEDASVYSFTGGTKIINNKLPIEWNTVELFNLLWQYLGNATEGGAEFRNGCEQHFKQAWEKYPDTDIWQIPEDMRRDAALQRKIFHALTGEWMGDSAKSGYPYVWLPNHLEDGFGKVSPCSFLAALHEAANTDALAEETQFPLNYIALKKGVQKASQMQVSLLNETAHWIYTLLKGKDISFPCETHELDHLWSSSILSEVDSIIQESGKIPPPSYKARDYGFDDIKRDLIAMGIFQQMLDGRINIPEVYRIGFGLGRKGGIKPAK